MKRFFLLVLGLAVFLTPVSLFGQLDSEGGMQSGSDAQAQEFQKELERFTGLLFEHKLILASLQEQIDSGLKAEDLSQESRTTLLRYRAMVAEATSKLLSYQAELRKFSQTSFVQQVAPSPETQAIAADLDEAWGTIEGLLTEVQASPEGLSQSWFMDAVSKCDEVLARLEQLSERAQAQLDQNSADKEAANLLKRIADYQTQIGQLMRDFNIAEVPEGVLTEMQDIDDMLSDSILSLQSQIDAYNTEVSAGDQERRLRNSLSILNDFSKSRRLYLNAQRLYDATNRAASGQKFKSAEQVELDAQFDRISNTFNQLGSVADELNSRLNDLESQLSGFLK